MLITRLLARELLYRQIESGTTTIDGRDPDINSTLLDRLTAELYLALALYHVVVVGRAMLDWPDRAKRERKRWATLQAESLEG